MNFKNFSILALLFLMAIVETHSNTNDLDYYKTDKQNK